MNLVTRSLHAGFRGQARQFFELSDEFRPAIRVSAVVQRVHSDENIVRPDHFGPGQSVAQEDCVPRRDVGNGNSARYLVCATIFWNFDRIG